jgi:hypothetical protein
MNTNIFKKINLKVSFSSGVANDKTVFVPPCILLEATKRPKLRFKNQNLFLKKYLKKTSRKDLKDMTNSEYIKYITESEKNGETKEYIKWWKDNQKKILYIKKLISDFNRIKNKRKITLLVFEDGTMRIESGSQSTSVFKKRGKIKLSGKKIMLKEMIRKLELFVNFVKENI